MAKRVSEQIREALAEVEEQRDDAVVYLSAIKVLLDVLARGHSFRQCAQEIAEALVHQLALGACAVALWDDGGADLTLAGFATRGQRVGGLDEAGWLALARLVKPGVAPTCFRRTADGGFEPVAPADLASEGFLVVPFAVGGETGGAVVLHSLHAPAQIFVRARAFALLADIVGQTLTVARMREAMVGLCGDLEGELGITRRELSDHQQSLRAHEENVQTLTHALIRSNRVKREFLGTVSHELRTPLNAILGYTSLMRDGMTGPLSQEQSGVLDRVLANTRNLNWLIDDILFFVQLEADRVLIRRERLATADLIEAVMAEMPEQPDRPRVPLRVEIAPEAATVRVDGGLVRRILFHLLSNAFKFTAAGEVAVTVRPGDELGAALLVVRDTGTGIAADSIDAVFALFVRGDASATRRHGGLGMGLTLVQGCVRLLGGDVVVESRPGAGSEFRVRIPDALSVATDDDPEPVATRLMH
jgi:signal transduction histidine kinase